jgi:hypothetical protein
MPINTFGKSTRRQLLEDQIAASRNIINKAQDPSAFGDGRAGAFGAIAQGLTAGIGAYGQYKAKQELIAQESQDINNFSQFMSQQGNPELASIAGSLTPETRQAIMVNKVMPMTRSNGSIPANIQEYEYYKNLPKSEQTQYLKSQGKLEGEKSPSAPAGYRFTQSGNLESIPGGPATKQSAESAGKVALIKQGLSDVESLDKNITNPDGSYNRAKIISMNLPGEIGSRDEYSKLYNSINARLRLESGAAVPPAEVKAAFTSFAPRTFDSDKTIRSKLQRQKDFFLSAEKEIGQGRGAKPINNPENTQTLSSRELAIQELRKRGKIK